MNRFSFNSGYERSFDLTVIKDEQIVIGARFRLNPEGRTCNIKQNLSNSIYQDVLPEFIIISSLHDKVVGIIDGQGKQIGRTSMKSESVKKYYEAY